MSSPRFANKVVLITGASSGIGRATAVKLASQGATLSLSDINDSGLQETKSLCTEASKAHLLSLVDVGSSVACNELVEKTVQHFGQLDLVFNCAGVNPTAYPLTSTTDEYWDKLVNTNLKGTYNVTRASMFILTNCMDLGRLSSLYRYSTLEAWKQYCQCELYDGHNSGAGICNL